MDLTKYYTEICKVPILKKEEEKELLTRYVDPTTPEKEKDKIKDRVIRANLRFAFKQAKNYSKNDPSIFVELISAANEGLLVGLEKFDPSRDIRFLSYAGWWVIQRILDEMSNMRIVSLPKWKQQLASRITKALDNNDSLSLRELKEIFVQDGISEKDIEEMYRTRYLTYYIDDLEEENFQFDLISETVEKNLDAAKIQKKVSELPSPHREVVARCFGLEDGIEWTPAKLSRVLRVEKEDIQKLKIEGINMLRQSMNA